MKTIIVIQGDGSELNGEINNILREENYDSMKVNNFFFKHGLTITRREIDVVGDTERIFVEKVIKDQMLLHG